MLLYDTEGFCLTIFYITKSLLKLFFNLLKLKTTHYWFDVQIEMYLHFLWVLNNNSTSSWVVFTLVDGVSKNFHSNRIKCPISMVPALLMQEKVFDEVQKIKKFYFVIVWLYIQNYFDLDLSRNGWILRHTGKIG